MKSSQKKLILLLSLMYLYNISPISIAYSQGLSPNQPNSGLLPGSSVFHSPLDATVSKEKFNDVPDSITVPNPQDVLNLDTIFYPNLNSTYGDLSGLDILTFDKLKEKFVKARKHTNNIHVEEIPEIYQIALSTLREESKDYIRTVNIGNDSSENFVNVSVKKKDGELDTGSQETIDRITRLISRGDQEEAIKLIDKEAFKPRKDPWYMAKLAGLYEQVGKYNRAAGLYDKALDLKPGRIELLYSYAYCLYKDDKLDKAEKNMNKVLEIDPKFTLAHYHLGNIHFKDGEYYEALKSYNEAIKLNPLSADAYYNTGLILEIMGKKDLAAKYYDRCLTLKSDDNQAKDAIQRLQN
ncbi:MAG: hypothetical protein ACD_20C00234G0006 [uncultured bacterium]|nr:MAG: hypothetical protein ACD_20C00234G0006 [uncultured bacterium]HBH18791.1 hypothetical protein [Cyanobacteria bacterium UBA9579]